MKHAGGSNPLAAVRVLFVENDRVRRLAMAEQLAQHGAQADGFGTAAEALAALEAAVSAHAPYRIAILDRQMPGIDGETIGKVIMAESRFSATSLVLLSDAVPGDLTRLAEAGFSALLCKPVSPQLLTETLSALCARGDESEAPAFITNAGVTASHPAPSRPVPRFSGYRILVADDNIVNRQVALRMLKNLGCSADAAIDGRQAVSMHQAQSYDLILMDCQMPGLDGYQATAMIRNFEAGSRRTPVIAWSADATPAEQERCLKAGMDDFMTKPLRPIILQDMLERRLRPAEAEQPESGAAGNRDELEAIREMFGADFTELAMLFLADSPKRIIALQQAEVKNDIAAMANVAHALSGSTAAIGARALAALCKDLESKLRAGLLTDIASRLKSIEAEYARIEARLRSMAPPKNA